MTRCLLAIACLLAPSAVEAGQDGGVRYKCIEKLSRIELAHSESREAADPRPVPGTVEWIDPSAQVDYEEDGRGDLWRTGSRTIERHCGELLLRIDGGYFNHKTQGEMGASEDYAIVEIIDREGRSSGRLAMGTCSLSLPRYNYLVECPKDWAMLVIAFPSTHPRTREPDLHLSVTHQYEEFRQTDAIGEAAPVP